MESTPAPKKKSKRSERSKCIWNSASNSANNSDGIALFMVIASVSVLAILVTEFTYIAQISQSIAFGGLDQAKAHYLAKSGLKLSLLRLKAYQKGKDLLSKGGGAAAAAVPKSLLQKIWSFPFFYPLPTNIPGMNSTDKTAIEKFQKSSNLEGQFSARIESESSKYNLNMLLPGYSITPSPTPSTNPNPPGTSSNGTATDTNPAGNPTPQPAPSYNPQDAQNNLKTYLTTILNQKFEDDPDFAANYRDFRMEDFMDNLVAWADRSYDRKTSSSQDKVPMKRAPFYSLSEMHMIPGIDDQLYELFAPTLTVSPTAGINVNTMQEATLRALLPGMTKQEVTEFFKFRDSEETDNMFQTQEKFWDYIGKSVAIYTNNPQSLTQLKADLDKRKVSLVVDETQFKITVRAQVNKSVRTIEAWVTLGDSSSGTSSNNGKNPPPTNNGNTGTQGNQNPPNSAPPSSGLKITFMRIL